MTWGAAVMLLARAAARIEHREAIATLTTLLGPHSGLFSWYGSGTVGPFDLALAELALAAGDRNTARLHIDAAQTQIDRIGATVYRPDLDSIRAQLTR